MSIGERPDPRYAKPQVEVEDGQRPRGSGVDSPPPSTAASVLTSPEVEPTSRLTRRRILIGAALMAFLVVGLYFLVPKLAGLENTWGTVRHGDPLWLALGAALELFSVVGYAVLFGTVFGRGMPRIDWRASIEIPLAGIAAIRLLAAAGAGGVALTVWALRNAGMSARTIACRMVANYAIQYGIYLGALVVCGFGLWAGAFAGGGSFAITVLPAIFSAAAVALVASMGLVPQDFERRLESFSHRPGRAARLAARLAAAPSTVGSGIRTAADLIRDRRTGLLGAVAYWGFDIAVLGVCFRAFGLPADRSLVAVLAYRAISFWLPTLPGIFGYLSLRSTVRRWRVRDQLAKAAAESK